VNQFEPEKSAPLEGTEEVKAEGTKSTTAPEPIVEGKKFLCPICKAAFPSKKQYLRHALDAHKIGSAVSTAIY
jgi:hypothetical protein